MWSVTSFLLLLYYSIIRKICCAIKPQNQSLKQTLFAVVEGKKKKSQSIIECFQSITNSFGQHHGLSRNSASSHTGFFFLNIVNLESIIHLDMRRGEYDR